MLVMHSLLRWILLGAGTWATLQAWLGWQGKRPWTASHRSANLAFLVSADLQLVLGLIVYMGSDLVHLANADMAAAMKTPALRFFAVEHAAIVVLGLAALHIAYAKVKRAAQDSDKHRLAAIGFTVALLLFLLAIPWPFRAQIGRSLLPF